MDALKYLTSWADSIGMGTLIMVAGIVLTVVAYISNDISFLEATAAIGFTGVGSYGVGRVRNEAGKGVKE